MNSESSEFAEFQKAYVSFFGPTGRERPNDELYEDSEESDDISKAIAASDNKEEKDDSVVPSTGMTRSNKESKCGKKYAKIPSLIDEETSRFSDISTSRMKKTKLKNKVANAKISASTRKKRNSDGPHTCDLCNKKFRLRDSLKIHARVHTEEKQFTCHICGKQFVQTGCLYYHLKHVHGGVKNHSCDICGRCFALRTTMEDHRRSIHTGERPFVCDSCGKTFKTKSSLYIHSRTHTESFPHECKYCKKVFRWKQQLLGHLTIHTGEKKHSCDVCGKAFGVKNYLTRHKRVHSADKPYTCQQCGMSFGQKRYLTTHQRSRHK